MSTQRNRNRLIAAALLAIGNSAAFANTCDQPSALKQELGESYWDVGATIEIAKVPRNKDVQKASAENADAVSVLEFLNSRHYRAVSGTRVDCRGAGSSLRQLEFDSTLKLADYVKKESGRQYIRFLEKLANERKVTNKDHKIDVVRGTRANLQSVILDLPPISEWLVHSPDEIHTSQINRRRNNRGFAYLQQLDTELERVAEGVRLSQTLYVNGYRANWATWTLVR